MAALGRQLLAADLVGLPYVDGITVLLGGIWPRA